MPRAHRNLRRQQGSVTLLLGTLVLALMPGALSGCASASFDGRSYQGHGVSFATRQVPTGWHEIQVPQGLLAFRDPAQDASILVNGRCGVDGDDVPLEALTAHLYLRFTARQTREQETLPFDGREAMRTVMDAKLDGVPRSLESFVLKKDGCVYDLVLVTPPQTFDAARGSFESFARGFHAGANP